MNRKGPGAIMFGSLFVSVNRERIAEETASDYEFETGKEWEALPEKEQVDRINEALHNAEADYTDRLVDMWKSRFN